MSKIETRIENGYLFVSEPFYPDHKFEIVDFVPLGYEIWNIGHHMPDGWLPLCRLSQYQRFEGGMDIEVDTLKAIKCDGAQIILAAIGFAPSTLDEMEAYVKKHEKNKYKKFELERMRKALPYMRKLKWN